jgi:hypothetical protein
MASFELTVRIDRSIPYHKLSTFPRFWSWNDAETLTTSDPTLTVRLLMPEEMVSLSPRWDAVYHYGIATRTDADGKPVFQEFPQGTVAADAGVLECALRPGANYLLVERAGGILRDYRGGEAVPGSSVWSKAKVSGYLIVMRDE